MYPTGVGTVVMQHVDDAAASQGHESNDSMDEEQLSIASDATPGGAKLRIMEPKKISSKAITPLNIKAPKSRIGPLLLRRNPDGSVVKCRSWRRAKVEIKTLEGQFSVPMWASRKSSGDFCV